MLLGILGLLSSFFNYPYNKISFIEIGIGFLLLTYTYLKTTKRQHHDGVFSQWTEPKVFMKMTLNNAEKYLFFLGVVMIFSPLISFLLRINY